MQKVAIYCRLSDEDRNKIDKSHESESIQNQKAMLIEYAQKNEMDIYRVYCDEDYSGADSNRPEFNELLNDAENKKFNIVLCKTQSRFTRDMIIVENYIHNKFNEWGIRFIAILDNVDTANKGGKKARQINGLVNEWYLEDLSANLKSVLANKKSRGKFTGAFPPYGYLKDSIDKNHLIIDEDVNQVIIQIFDWFVNKGYSIVKIVKSLNYQFIQNPSTYKKTKYTNYKNGKSTISTGHLWSNATVRDILSNQVYIGNMVQGKVKTNSYKNSKLIHIPKDNWIIVENTHEPIIDKCIFNKAQIKLKSNIHPDKKSGEVYVLAGKLKCAYCGSKLTKYSCKGLKYMRCRKQVQYSNGCQGVNVSCNKIEKIILDEIKKMSVAYNTNESILLEQHQKLKNDLSHMESIKLQLQKEIENISNAIVNLYIDKTNGTIPKNMFPDMNNNLVQRKEELDNKLKVVIQNIENEKNKTQRQQNFKEIILKYTTLTEKLIRQDVEELIDYVKISNNGTNKNQKIIEIHWNI